MSVGHYAHIQVTAIWNGLDRSNDSSGEWLFVFIAYTWTNLLEYEHDM